MNGETRLWCDRLVRGLAQHEFDIYALSRGEEQEAHGRAELPPQVGRVRTAPLWTVDDEALRAARPRGRRGRRTRRRFDEHFAELAEAVCRGDRDAMADRFGNALYGLAELAR
ncbi:DUF3492 domain-containing protein, partial [Streptomyces sp. SID10115]|uniref:DUF3492 domain-containing protein n=1 Tax=Streptomyces sp. SID10115 TaxID=2706016 RepID=UPI0032171919